MSAWRAYAKLMIYLSSERRTLGLLKINQNLEWKTEREQRIACPSKDNEAVPTVPHNLSCNTFSEWNIEIFQNLCIIHHRLHTSGGKWIDSIDANYMYYDFFQQLAAMNN